MKPAATSELFRQRATAYRKHTWPYLRYVAQSGLPIVIGFGGVVFLAFYTNLLRTYPSDFPLTQIAVVLLTFTLAISPIRTYSQKADSLFLMRATTAMHGYFRMAFYRAYAWQAALLIVVWLFLWPLYRLRERLEGAPLIEGWFWLCTAFLVLVKALSMFAGWREDQLRDNAHRGLLTVLRWGVICASLIGLFVWQLPVAAGVAVLGFSLHYFLTSRVPAYSIHWEHLVIIEQAAIRRIHSFLRGFVDLPTEQARVSRRRLVTFWTRRIPIHPSETYRYLYWLQLLRTERLSMLVRMTLLVVVIMVIVTDYRVLLCLYALAVFVLSVQLTGFWRETKPVAWIHMYPLPASQRASSYSRIVLHLHAVLVPVIALPLWFHQDLPVYGSLLALVAGWLWSWRTGRRILALERKRENE